MQRFSVGRATAQSQALQQAVANLACGRTGRANAKVFSGASDSGVPGVATRGGNFNLVSLLAGLVRTIILT